MRFPQKWGSGPPEGDEEDNPFVSATDIMTVAMAGFLLTLAIMLPWINPEAKTKIPPTRVFYETVKWNTCIEENEADDQLEYGFDEDIIHGRSSADIDPWTQLTTFDEQGRQIKDVIGYKIPDRKSIYFVLDQDDVGNPNPFGDIDLEIISSNLGVLQDGNYLVNLHLYGDNGDFKEHGKVCADVKVAINLGESNEKVVCETNIIFYPGEKGMQKTACQFDVLNGNFVEGSDKYVIDIPIWQVSTVDGP